MPAQISIRVPDSNAASTASVTVRWSATHCVSVSSLLTRSTGLVSQASPTPSPSRSAWDGLLTSGQLSSQFMVWPPVQGLFPSPGSKPSPSSSGLLSQGSNSTPSVIEEPDPVAPSTGQVPWGTSPWVGPSVAPHQLLAASTQSVPGVVFCTPQVAPIRSLF